MLVLLLERTIVPDIVPVVSLEYHALWADIGTVSRYIRQAAPAGVRMAVHGPWTKPLHNSV